MSDYQTTRERLLELLADQATVGLGDSDHDELQRLLVQHPDVDRDSFEYAAASIDLAFVGPSVEPLPRGLRDRLLAAAPAGTDATYSESYEPEPETYSLSDDRDEEPEAPKQTPRTPSHARDREVEPRRSWGWLGWTLAAACLGLAVLGWWPELTSGRRLISASTQYAQLSRLDPNAITIDWTVKDPLARGASGDIIFSTTRQEGAMRLRGLVANDATKNVYQLWIFDGRRGSPPVDGGVFNVGQGAAEGSDTYVSFRPKLNVEYPVLFAITLEQPGGVVVSKQDPLLLIAPLKKG